MLAPGRRRSTVTIHHHQPPGRSQDRRRGVPSIPMHIVILGCGRVGAMLADRLDEEGHSVSIIDQQPRAFRRLSHRFAGTTITGVGFDRQTLEDAGISAAHAFAAVSSGDNTNIIAARTARETYGVEHVVARIYDPRRAEVYQRLGIPTVATVSWTTGQIIRRLLPQGGEVGYQDPSGSLIIVEVAYHERWIGETLRSIESHIGSRIAYLTRLGAPIEASDGLVLQQGDLLHIVTIASRRIQIEETLAVAPADGTPR